ncbi:MAG TPA: hypothetical protein VEA38_12460 [Terriglobales bacterium]|nr:hypothetical protein [Terriglobales bacterium]
MALVGSRYLEYINARELKSDDMRRVVNHVELWLTALGFLLILGVRVVVPGDGGVHWPVTARTAIAFGIVHGLIFWAIRARQRRVRREALEHGRQYLSQEIHRHLRALLALAADETPEMRIRLAGVLDSVAILEGVLDTLTEERLTVWSHSRL